MKHDDGQKSRESFGERIRQTVNVCARLVFSLFASAQFAPSACAQLLRGNVCFIRQAFTLKREFSSLCKSIETNGRRFTKERVVERKVNMSSLVYHLSPII